MLEAAETDRGALQGQVLGLLQNFSGTEPLKELFWSTLNYDRINRPTSRRKWPEETAAVLVDDPTLLAAGGALGEFQVLYSRLAKDRLSLRIIKRATEVAATHKLVVRMCLGPDGTRPFTLSRFRNGVPR
jgi:hypothetical protein